MSGSKTLRLGVNIDHVATDCLQAEAQLFLDFRIMGHGLFGFAGKRHPDTSHVHHDDQRPVGQAATWLLHAVVLPAGLDDGLE